MSSPVFCFFSVTDEQHVRIMSQFEVGLCTHISCGRDHPDHQTNHPDSLDCLLTAYNSIVTLSSLLDKHAPIITKISNRKFKSNPWFSHFLRAFRTTLRHAESVFKRTHSALD